MENFLLVLQGSATQSRDPQGKENPGCPCLLPRDDLKEKKELVLQTVKQGNGVIFSDVSLNSLPWPGTYCGSSYTHCLNFQRYPWSGLGGSLKKKGLVFPKALWVPYSTPNNPPE